MGAGSFMKIAGSRIFSDERIVDSSDFANNTMKDAEKKETETLRYNLNISDLGHWADK